MVAITRRVTTFRVRRLIALTLTTVAVITAWQTIDQVRRLMGDASMASGWMLLASTLCLYALGMRKRSTRLALGRVACWLQAHTYLGLFALAMFAWHVTWPITGRFEQALGGMFLFISLSGIALLIASRRVPRQLSAVKRDYRLEDIAQIQAALAANAHRAAMETAATVSGATLVEYYQRRLLPFFMTQRSWFYRAWPTGSRRRRLVRELSELDRYLDARGRAARHRFTQLVIAKDDTDYHRALQRRLQYMVLAHVALTWSLLIMIIVHIVLVMRFQGAMV